MERRTSQEKPERKGLYFSKPNPKLKYISTGSTLLDMTLGGGLPFGKMSNVIGDASTGKTLLATEACANLFRDYPKAKVWYRESEAAFEPDYAKALGIPVDKIDFGSEGIDTPWDTVEDIFEDLEKICDSGKPGLYIVDSLDALSDRAELKRKIDEGSYSMTKQKQLHHMFRKIIRKVNKSQIHWLIISQSKQKIGVMFGEKTTCTGDGSLQFYASQRLKLAKVKTLYVKRRDQNQAVGVRIKTKTLKNKIGSPFKECEFDIRFGFGVNDTAACLEFLISCGKTDEAELSMADAKKLLPFLEKLDQSAHEEWREPISNAVREVWPKLQLETLPTWTKYGNKKEQ